MTRDFFNKWLRLVRYEWLRLVRYEWLRLVHYGWLRLVRYGWLRFAAIVMALSNAIIALLEAHHYMINITIIKDLPTRILYQYLVKIWTENLYYVTDGLAGLEFCDHEPEDSDTGTLSNLSKLFDRRLGRKYPVFHEQSRQARRRRKI
jgi:hypothetical protein